MGLLVSGCGTVPLILADGGLDAGMWVGPVIPLAMFVLLWVLYFILATSGGPILAADEHGVWIRARKTPVKAIWLPWESVRAVFVRRWGLDRMVCVQPHDPAAGRSAGSLAALDQGMARALTGARFTASTVFSDKREPEIMAALRYYARGRTYVA